MNNELNLQFTNAIMNSNIENATDILKNNAFNISECIEEAFMDAIGIKNKDVINFLFENFTNKNIVLTRLLQVCVANNDMESFIYISNNYNVDLFSNNYPCLNLAVYNNLTAVFDYLFKENIGIKEDYYTALTACSVTGNINLFELIISHFKYENQEILDRVICSLFLNKQFNLFSFIAIHFNIAPLITEEWIDTNFKIKEDKIIINNFININNF